MVTNLRIFKISTQGYGVVATPAFRAPSFYEGARGCTSQATACPGPLKNTGDDARLLFENRIGIEAAAYAALPLFTWFCTKPAVEA